MTSVRRTRLLRVRTVRSERLVNGLNGFIGGRVSFVFDVEDVFRVARGASARISFLHGCVATVT